MISWHLNGNSFSCHSPSEKQVFSLPSLLIQTPPTPGSCYQSKSGRQRSLQAAKASPLMALLQTTKLSLKQSSFPGLYEVQWTKPQKRKHGSVFTENKKVYLLLFYVHDCFPSRMSMCCMSTVPGGARRRHKMPPEWELEATVSCWPGVLGTEQRSSARRCSKQWTHLSSPKCIFLMCALVY